jgi:hypothetical protein
MQTRASNRVVLLGRAAPADKRTGDGPPANKPATGRRTVLIRDGRLVGGEPSR